MASCSERIKQLRKGIRMQDAEAGGRNDRRSKKFNSLAASN